MFDSTVLINAFLKPGGVSDELLGFAGGTFALALAPEIFAGTRWTFLTPGGTRRRA